jgi:trans-2,3-dihydro-3-hydroxyanthranilate isomerase
MKLTYHVLDVFTETAYAGNPLAVVMEAEALDGDQMQTIAREFNLSETVFVLPPENATHSARIRIFTPASELPFAGHPTIGAAILLALLKFGPVERAEDAIVVLEENIGQVRVGVRLRPGEPAFAEFDVVKLPEESGTAAPVDRLAAALGLAPNEIGFENHRPMRCSAGLPFTFVPVRDLEVIDRAVAVPDHWEDAFGGDDHPAAYVYCRETIMRRSAFHARMFAPSLVPTEDPATGSAAASLAAVIQRFDEPPDGVHTYAIEQGYEMGRPSSISLEVEMRAGHLKAVRIGGSAVRVMTGEIEVRPGN